jgi:MerR family mercuric resistance operon transcriptional regulator
MGLTIGRAAQAAGVGVETIRFYERRGLIERPRRPDGRGFRQYPPETVARIRFIRKAQDLGFSLREAKDLLALEADASADCGDARDRAAAKLDDVSRRIAALERIRAALQDAVAACPGAGAPLRRCAVMEALAGEPHR